MVEVELPEGTEAGAVIEIAVPEWSREEVPPPPPPPPKQKQTALGRFQSTHSHSLIYS